MLVANLRQKVGLPSEAPARLQGAKVGGRYRTRTYDLVRVKHAL